MNQELELSSASLQNHHKKFRKTTDACDQGEGSASEGQREIWRLT